MAGKNDILATAGVDLSAFEAGIAKLTSRLDAVEKAGNKAASGIEKVDKSAKDLKNIQIADHFVNALGQIAGKGGQAAQSIGQLDQRAALNNFSTATDNLAAFGKVAGTSIDIFAKMPGRLGVIGAAGQVLVTSLVNQSEALTTFNIEAQHYAKTTDAMLARDVRLAEVQEKLAELPKLNASRIESLTDARQQNAKAFESQARKEADLSRDTTAGHAERAEQVKIEAERLQSISDITAKLKRDGKGVISPEKKQILSAATDKINAEADAAQRVAKAGEMESAKKRQVLIDSAKIEVSAASNLEFLENQNAAISKQYDLVRRNAFTRGTEYEDQVRAEKNQSDNAVKVAKLDAQKEASEIELNSLASARGISIQDQLDSQKDLLKELEKQKAVALATFGLNSKQFNLVAAQKQQAANQALEQKFQLAQQLNAMQLQGNVMLAELAGNKKLADLEKNNAQFENQIRDAQKQKLAGVAQELQLQKNLNELKIKAEDFLKTPQERQQERKDQQERNRGLRGAAGREFGKLSPEEQQKEREKRQKEQQEKRDKKAETDKGNSGKKGAYGRTNSNDFTSKPTEEAVKDFADRNKLVIPKEQQGILAMKDFIAKSLTINGIFQNAP